MPSADLDSWGVVALVAATVLGVDVDVDVAAEAAADDGVGAVALGVGAGGREISWSTMEPGRPSLLSSCLMDHETIGHDARPGKAMVAKPTNKRVIIIKKAGKIRRIIGVGTGGGGQQIMPGFVADKGQDRLQCVSKGPDVGVPHKPRKF